MNAKQWISSQCSVLFEETTPKAVWVQNSLFYFTVVELMMEICLQGTVEIPPKATFTALTTSAPVIAPSICSASL